MPISYELDSSKSAINSIDISFGVEFLDGSGVKVAILDSGVAANPNNVALPENSKIVKRLFCDVNSCNDNPSSGQIGDSDTHSSGFGHGTVTAGIIAGLVGSDPDTQPSGVAPGAQIIDTRFAVDTAIDNEASNALALDLALVYGAEVINLSISIDDNSKVCSFTTVNHVMDEAVDLGVFIVKSAGNESNTIPGKITDPGCSYNIMTVGNFNEDTNQTHVTSSPGPVNQTHLRLKPEVVAPGYDILAPVKSGGWGSDPEANTGTSVAAPHVSGAAALLLQSHPEATPLEIRSALMVGADWVPATMDPTLPLTANSYETATQSWIDNGFHTLSGSLKDHSRLNLWGFGLIDVTASNDLFSGNHMIHEFFVAGSPSNHTYEFIASQGEVVKILLSWKHRPTLTTNFSLDLNNIQISTLSNLDLSLAHTSAPGNEIAFSTSTIQNNEFIIFEAGTGSFPTGTYILTVTPTSITSGIGLEPYVIDSTHQLGVPGGPGNALPRILIDTDFDIVLDVDETFTININAVDGDDITFFVHSDPANGSLSAFKHFNDPGLNYNAIINYTAGPTFTGTDLFDIRPYDGKDLGAVTRIDIVPSVRNSGTTNEKNSSLNTNEEFNMNFGPGGLESVQAPLPTDPDIGALEIQANGVVAQYTIASSPTVFTEHIPPFETEGLLFSNLETLTSLTIYKQVSFGSEDVVVGYVNSIPTPNVLPIADVQPTFLVVDEGTTGI